MPVPRRDLSGRTFGRLTVVAAAAEGWVCRCQCGTTKTVRAGNLIAGRTQSCGCYGHERRSERMQSHGLTGTKIWRTWKNMRQRCENPKNSQYHLYGGRGITVCERWQDLSAFHADMGDPPSPRFSIDRINNARGYEPGNCRWATTGEQARNTRRTRLMTLNGQTKALKDWCAEYGASYMTVLSRLKAGMELLAALTTPRYGKRP